MTTHDTHLAGTDTDTPASAAPATAAGAKRRRPALLAFGERFGLVGLLLLLVAVFAINPASGPAFFSVGNLQIVLANQSVVMIVAIAVLIPLISGHFDFSVGATSAISAMVCASLQVTYGQPLIVAIPAAIVVAAAIGMLNGYLVARLGLNSFVATLGVATFLGGIIQWHTGGLAITGIDPALRSFGTARWLGIPSVVYIVMIVLVMAWYVLTQTPYGRALYATGANPRAALLAGVPTTRYTWIAFVAAGTIAGIAGIVLTARTGGANPDNGMLLLFPALAAVFLGVTTIQPGRFNVWGTVVGVLFVAVSVSGLVLSGAQSWVDGVFNGAALVLAVTISTFLRRKRAGS